ncbi:hypothetical protein GCM10027168_41320 [Streptomyces capparidis]
MTVAPATPAPPRWAVRLARVAALAPLPSGLWRLALACHVPLGFGAASDLHPSRISAGLSVYMVTLTLVAEGLGLLALGLVRPWGEVFPRWLPVLGGRRVPVPAAVVPAGLGAAVLILLGALGAVGWNSPENMGSPDAPQGLAYWVMTLAYAPLLLWGPALAVLAAHYRGRRTRATPRPGLAVAGA